MSALPESWRWSTIGATCSDVSYGFTTSASLVGSRAKLLRITDIQNGSVDWALVPRCSETPSPTFFLRAGDLVIARTGATVGKSFLILDTPEPVVFASYLIRLRFHLGLISNFAHAFLRTADYWKQIQVLSKGTAQPGANASILSSVRLPVPPSAEQRRIVAKVDRLSARSKRARDEIERLEFLVRHFKRSTLSAAYEDGLGVVGSAELVPLEDCCSSISDGDHQAPPKAEAGVPFITISALQNGKAILEKATRFVPQGYFDGLKPTRRPSPNDILFSVTGTIGQAALVHSAEPFVFQRHIAILRPLTSNMPKYLFYLLSSPQLLAQVQAIATGTAQLTVPISGLRKALIPSATAEAQAEIVRRIEHTFAAIDRLAAEAQSARALLDKIDQAILAKAFRGELVPQDPNDEPASVLLEHIRAERAAAPPKPRGRRKA